jgi:hypothetical protein
MQLTAPPSAVIAHTGSILTTRLAHAYSLYRHALSSQSLTGKPCQPNDSTHSVSAVAHFSHLFSALHKPSCESSLRGLDLRASVWRGRSEGPRARNGRAGISWIFRFSFLVSLDGFGGLEGFVAWLVWEGTCVAGAIGMRLLDVRGTCWMRLKDGSGSGSARGCIRGDL